MIVMVRGRKYASVEHAAKALNVTKSTIYCCLSRGTIDNVGRGRGVHAHHHIANKKPIKIAGRTFESRSELARFIGRCPKAVRHSLTRGPDALAAIEAQVMQAVMKLDNKRHKSMERESQRTYQETD